MIKTFEFYHNKYEEGFEPFLNYQMDGVETPFVGDFIYFEGVVEEGKKFDLSFSSEQFKVVGISRKYYREEGKLIESIHVEIDCTQIENSLI